MGIVWDFKDEFFVNLRKLFNRTKKEFYKVKFGRSRVI